MNLFARIIGASLRHRLLVVVASLLLVALGTASLREQRVDVLPDLNKPTLTVMTEAPGMAPEQIEQLVSFPLEAALNGLPRLQRLRSTSAPSLSVINLEFDWDTDVYRNRQLVSERLSLIQEQLPPDISPKIGPVASIMGEIMLIALYSDQDAVGPMRVRELADWVVRPRLLAVPGVSQVIPIGGEVRQYQISPDVLQMRQLGVSLEQIEAGVRGFATNTSGGFIERGAQEYVVRYIGQSTRLEDLRDLVVAESAGRPILLGQVARVEFGARVKRGDAGFDGRPAVILSVQKQPEEDTLRLTRELHAALAALQASLPAGVHSQVLFSQARFIDNALDNLRQALRDAALIVAVVLFLFLLNTRTTLISLLAVPVSILITLLVFRLLDLSINTMTLGGIAIAIGELVDDAVVDVENIFRRLRERQSRGDTRSVLRVVLDAAQEVRSGVVHATYIVVLVFVPLFALGGIEGRLFAPLGIAYIVSILASLLVAVTLTPALAYYLLPGSAARTQRDSPLLTRLKHWDRRLLHWSFERQRLIYTATAAAVLVSLAGALSLDRIFLPPFNEGSLTVNLVLQPGTSLAASNDLGRRAEQLLLQIPEVQHVGRRTGRAELDEHAEGVHYSELDLELAGDGRQRAAIVQEVRHKLSLLPAQLNIGQPISHRLDHLLSGVRAQLSLKLYGDDLDRLRSAAEALAKRLETIDGLVDVQVETQVRVPQLQVLVDYARARQYGVTPAAVTGALQTLTNGRVLSQVLDGAQRLDVVIRLEDSRRNPQDLSELLIETPGGRIPLRLVATIVETDGLNQIRHENGRRRIVVAANTDSSDMQALLAAVRASVAALSLPEGTAVSIEGQFQESESATRLIAILAAVSLTLILLVLYSRYRSLTLCLIILVNVPLALVGSVLALSLSANPVSVASLVGFITLTGIVTRNGILKVSHYINLIALEGEAFGRELVVRGSLERLAPVLMTALGAALALLPLVWGAGEPGKEILHPVAVVIFGGLISATLLDTLLTPVLFLRLGRAPVARLLAVRDREAGF
jgi:HME family heavy-metal exporter